MLKFFVICTDFVQSLILHLLLFCTVHSRTFKNIDPLLIPLCSCTIPAFFFPLPTIYPLLIPSCFVNLVFFPKCFCGWSSFDDLQGIFKFIKCSLLPLKVFFLLLLHYALGFLIFILFTVSQNFCFFPCKLGAISLEWRNFFSTPNLCSGKHLDMKFKGRLWTDLGMVSYHNIMFPRLI